MACKITDNCFEYIKNEIKVNISEREIAHKIEEFFIKNGAEGVSFNPIVASRF